MINWFLYQGYCNPALMICLSGFILHPSFSWFIGLLVVYIFQLIALTWADAQCSIKHLTEAYNDIISGDKYILHLIDNSTTKSIQEFSSIGIYQKLPVPMKKIIKASPWYVDVYKEPLRVFIAEGKEGKSLGEPKAYTNFRGSSLVFLHRPFDELDTLDRFFLLHELEHVNLDGAMQLSQIYSRPLLVFFNLVLLCFLATSWWHWVLIAIYVIINLFAHLQSTGKREVIADNGALLKLSNTEEQKEVITDLIDFGSSVLQGTNLASEWMKHSFSFRAEEIKEVRKERMKIHKLNASLPKKDRLTHSNIVWMDRLFHFRWYEYKLKEDQPIPHLGWSSFYDNVAMLPFSLFFLYIGIISTSAPTFPLILIVIFIILDVFWMQFGYMNQLVKVINKIESKVVKPDVTESICVQDSWLEN